MPGLIAQPGEIEGLTEVLAQLDGAMTTKIHQVLSLIGIKTIEFLRSFTDRMAPPIRKGDPERRRHPGFWADRTGQLAASYGWEVKPMFRGAALELTNISEHAPILEAREGYFVLSGVTDKGGPVETALRQAVAAVAPGWEVRSYD